MTTIQRAMFRPKMDWHGDAYRWVCRDCDPIRYGTWQAYPGHAERDGRQHDRDKHPGKDRTNG